MTAPAHDPADPLEVEVAHDESATVEERQAMLDALRRLRVRTGNPTRRQVRPEPPPGHAWS